MYVKSSNYFNLNQILVFTILNNYIIQNISLIPLFKIYSEFVNYTKKCKKSHKIML